MKDGCDLTFFVNVTGHLNTLLTHLQDKDKLIKEMFDSIKVFKVKLQLWENQLNVRDFLFTFRI
jgi:hypothetical protein